MHIIRQNQSKVLICGFVYYQQKEHLETFLDVLFVGLQMVGSFRVFAYSDRSPYSELNKIFILFNS